MQLELGDLGAEHCGGALIDGISAEVDRHVSNPTPDIVAIEHLRTIVRAAIATAMGLLDTDSARYLINDIVICAVDPRWEDLARRLWGDDDVFGDTAVKQAASNG